jgi:class 3 adenylate cyclase
VGLFELNSDSYVMVERDGRKLNLVKKEDWQKFDSSVLGIGDISRPSVSRSVICVIFDLEGFTRFCNQIDPDLVIPVFLKKYLDWFFVQIQNETKNREYDEGIRTWHDLPFLIKFMGDGLLVLWDIANLDFTAQGNIIVSSLVITQKYPADFLPKIKKIVVDPPNKLRCGITKGKVYSVGDGQDYVGQCINFASRLQKMPGATFAFSNRGIDLEEAFKNESVRARFIEKVIEARGIGENELVYILKDEFDAMDETDKQRYRDVF